MSQNDNLKLDEPMNGRPEGGYFFDYLYVLVKRRKLILRTVFATAILSAAMTLLMPSWYAATASLMPPKRPGGLMSLLEGGVGSVLKNLPGLSGSLSSQQGYSYMAILQSRTAMERVVQKFDLVKVYDISKNSTEKAVKRLRDNAEFDVATEGNILITVYDKDPQRAADMANYFIDLLNNLSVELGTTEARGNREFIERRYLQNVQDLKGAEDSMKVFQQKYGIYALPEQTESAIKAAAELKSESMAREVELGIAQRSFGEDNPKTEALRVQLAELNKKLQELKYGTADWYKAQSLSLFVPFKDVPELGTEYVRRYRELQIQNRLMEFILPLYEQAKIDEHKDTPVVLVLDRAIPPERKAKPKRTLIVLVLTTLALMTATAWAFVAEIYDREKERNSKVAAMREELTSGRFYRQVIRRFQ